jgi:2,3-dihydroxybenzoate decarboxylase
MTPKIALEEHCMTPGLADYWLPTMTDVPATVRDMVLGRLNDYAGERIEIMDRSGISRSILAIAGPGVQAERDTALATHRARESNDQLAEHVAKNPKRLGALAHLAVQDAKGAADELERCVKQLGFKGAMINGHTRGLYLDHPSVYPLWERAEALGAPIYIHPTDPVAPAPVLDGVHGVRRATWEWGFETGSHALRLVFSGTFDRFPKAKLILGHLGETLPYLLWRFDSRAKLYGVKLKKQPSEYIRENIWVTLSGMYSAEPMRCAIDALGADRVMFSADYPFEDSENAGRFMDTTPLADDLRADVAHANAARLLGLPQ